MGVVHVAVPRYRTVTFRIRGTHFDRSCRPYTGESLDTLSDTARSGTDLTAVSPSGAAAVDDGAGV